MGGCGSAWEVGVEVGMVGQSQTCWRRKHVIDVSMSGEFHGFRGSEQQSSTSHGTSIPAG